MTAIPEVYDYLYSRWKLMAGDAGLTADQILDGPAAQYAGSEGVAVGATATDTTADIDYPSAALDGSEAEVTPFPNLIWSGSGDTTFRARRDRVKAIFAVIRADLARDRTLGGLVSDSWITGGSFDQSQVSGALVTFEFRIQYQRF